MPIYEYACRSCGHQFETIQKASEAALTDCPACGKATLKKLLSAPVFRLKGGGWYETDFKTGNKKNVSDGGESDKAGGDGGDGKIDGSDAGKKTDAAKTKDTKSTDSKASSSTADNAAARD